MSNSAIQGSVLGVATEAQRGVVNGSDLRNLAFGGSALAFRNKIINGAMMVDQRNAGVAVTPANGAYTLDRWQCALSQASKLSIQQSNLAPAGFSSSLKVTSLSAYSVGASEGFRVQQAIEGFNIANLNWGTANAQSVTLSFRAYSSLTGTFGGSIVDSATAYSYPFSYTISAANTWTTVSVTIPGPTAGTWGSTNGVGLYVVFSMGAGASVSGTAGAWANGFFASATGATSVVGTSGATLYITGVQLEAGSVATPFEHRPIGVEEILCKRYYQVLGSAGNAYEYLGFGLASSSTVGYAAITFPISLRAVPTFSYSGSFRLDDRSAAYSVSSLALNGSSLFIGKNSIEIVINVSGGGLTAKMPYYFETSNDAAAKLNFSAEL